MSSENSERRQHSRHRVFRIEVKVATQDAFRASYLRDVSRGGIFVRSRKPLLATTRVVVELNVAGGPVLQIPGEVVRVEPVGFGVRFDALTAAQQEGLATLIAGARDESPGQDLSKLHAQLAEARGEIEAYEQSLAAAREAEMEAILRAETAEFERGLLAETAHELTTKLAAVDAERLRLSDLLRVTGARLAALDEEARARRADEQHHAEERKQGADSSQAHEKELRELEARLAREQEQAAKLSRALEGELERLPREAASQGLDEMRSELQELTEQLDDEKLKTMALQRALERFASMGGTVRVGGSEPGG